MQALKLIDASGFDALQGNIRRKVADARSKAESSSYPDATALLGAVFRGDAR
jgi:hypothetical protein